MGKTMVELPTDGESAYGERRRWDRYSPDGQTSMMLAAGGRMFNCELIDLSLGGARLRIDPDLPDDAGMVLQHPIGGLFYAAQTWRRGDQMGIRFRGAVQTREHALQCATVLLYDDGDTALPPARHDTGRMQASR
jgi:hypothetical protein